MKKTRTYSKLLFIAIFSMIISCSSDNSSDGEGSEIPENNQIPLPQINLLSSGFLNLDEELTITGSNFISEGNQTNLLVNGTAINITPISNTMIKILITPDLGIEELEIAVQIVDKISNTVNAFVVPDGWYKVNTTIAEYDIIKTFSFDDTKGLISLLDSSPSDDSYNGTIFNLSATENGYSYTSVSIADALLDLEMHNKNTGVATGSSFVYFTEDGFASNNMSNLLQIGLDTSIAHVDENSATMMNSVGKHVHTNDKGITFLEDESPDYLSTPTANGFQGNGLVRPIKKASDGYFYEIGFIFDTDPIDNYRNLIRKSLSYNNWTIVDSITPYNFALPSAKFLNPNYMLSVNQNNQLIESIDLAQNWTPIKDGIEKFYMRSETEWFAVSNQTIISTIDSGASWNLEFDLPAESVVNHIQFSPTKVVVSGNDGLLYIKHE